MPKARRCVRRCAEFDVPPEGANTTAGAECADYDTWNHGVFNMSKAHHNRYVRQLADDKAQLISSFKDRDLRVMLGTIDVCNCNAPGYATGWLTSHGGRVL
jgi:hypothetical protein